MVYTHRHTVYQLTNPLQSPHEPPGVAVKKLLSSFIFKSVSQNHTTNMIQNSRITPKYCYFAIYIYI